MVECSYTYTVADYMLASIHNQAVTHVFLVPGLTITPLINSLLTQENLEVIVPASEMGAAFMADGYARVHGTFGVCIAIANPGLMNLIPGLACASQDSIPILAITGSVVQSLEGRGAFQDAGDRGSRDVRIMSNITDYAIALTHAENLPSTLIKAFGCLLSPIKQSAFLQIPMDIQLQQINKPPLPLYTPLLQTIAPQTLAHLRTINWSQTHRIILLVGETMNSVSGGDVIRHVAECLNIPVATTLSAKGVLPEDHPLSLGVFGYGGTRLANQVILTPEIKILITLGVKYSQRNTLSWSKKLHKNCKIIQVDKNESEIGRNYPIHIGISEDEHLFLRALINPNDIYRQALMSGVALRTRWLHKLRTIPRHYDVDNRTCSDRPIHPARAIHDLRCVMPRETIVAVDSGAHRVFAAHYWQSYGPQQYLTSTNSASTGWAISAGIGAAFAKPNIPCVVITGDGCMLMHGNEIQTAAKYALAIIFVVINNQALASCDGFRELPNHNWQQYANALGLSAFTVSDPECLIDVFQRALLLNKPCLVDVKCNANVPIPNYHYERETMIHEELLCHST